MTDHTLLALRRSSGHPLQLPMLLCWLAVTAATSSAQEQRSPFGPCAPEIEGKIAAAILALDYSKALASTNQLEQDASTRFGNASRCYGAALSEQAAALQLLNRGIEAEPIFERAIALLRQHSGPNDPKLALALSNYGVNLFWTRRYQDAARAHEEALELRRTLQPADPAAVADSLHNLADVYRYLNRSPEDVKRLYEEALNIKLGLSPPDDVSIAQTRQNLASAQEALVQLKEASDNLEQALQTYRRRLKPDDTRIAGALNRQGLLSFRQGNYKQAESKFVEALSLQRASSNTQLITLAATLDDFTLNQIQLGRYDQARTLAQEALTIRRSVFSENHPTIARTLSNLSYISWLTRNNEDALSFAREASHITAANGRPDTASKFRYQRHLLVLWSKMAAGNSEIAQALSEEAFAIGQRAVRSDTANTVARTALRFSASEPRLRELLKLIDDLDRSSDTIEQNSYSFRSGAVRAFSCQFQRNSITTCQPRRSAKGHSHANSAGVP